MSLIRYSNKISKENDINYHKSKFLDKLIKEGLVKLIVSGDTIHFNNETINNMDEFKVKEGVRLLDKIKNLDNLLDHLKSSKQVDKKLEVINILTKYDNLMSGFDREVIAEIMLTGLEIKVERDLIQLKEEFEKL